MSCWRRLLGWAAKPSYEVSDAKSTLARRVREVAPLAFLRGALCLSSTYRKSSSCGMLPIYGYAHHPYTYPAVPGPFYRPSNPDDVPIGVLSRLSHAIYLASRTHAIPAHVPKAHPGDSPATAPASRVSIKPSRSKRYRTLRVVGTDADGCWSLRSTVRGVAWRVSWRSPSGEVYTGPAIRAF